MALSSTQKNALFWFVLVVSFVFILLEAYAVVVFIRDPTVGKGVFAGLSTLALASAFRAVVSLWQKEFLFGELITGELLLDTFHHRYNTVRSRLQPTAPKEISGARRTLIESYLRLLERLLNRKVGRHDFELSVFCDSASPRIVAYYDSSSRTLPRSHQLRQQNAQYYVQKNYEVVHLLRNPSAKFIVLSSTTSSNYSFATEAQKTQIRSTILHVISADWPAALVITCNRKNAFEESDGVLKDIVRGLGAAILVDLELGRANLSS